jgi:hypothetical protein
MRTFAAASGDWNPVHLDDARGDDAAFGEPVVFGVLGILASAAKLRPKPGMTLASVEARFARPLFVDVDYDVALDEKAADAAAVDITDGDVAICSVRLAFRRGSPVTGLEAPPGAPTRTEPADRSLPGLCTRPTATGEYRPYPQALTALLQRFKLAERGVGDMELTALLFTSYLVGMELPGFWSVLSMLRLELTDQVSGSTGRPAMRYEAAVVEADEQFRSVEVAAGLNRGATEVARVVCEAMVRPEPMRLDIDGLLRGQPPSDHLKGKVAIVVGASRGLGAAMSYALAAQGCSVYACSRRGLAPEYPDGQGSIAAVAVDGSDPRACANLRDRVIGDHGSIDYLLCIAAPPVVAVGFSPAATERFTRYVDASVRVAAVPLATFLPAIEAGGGGCLVASSAALESLPTDWGHYVVAKSAVETMVEWASGNFPNVEFLVARIPQMRTDRLNLLWRSEEALPVEEVATSLLGRLTRYQAPGVHRLEWDSVSGGAQRPRAN